ncbi:MAG: hypothetical protein GY706_05270 [Bacteroides sp.]|nr:hypothetical protein [Bacteroides sp.]
MGLDDYESTRVEAPSLQLMQTNLSEKAAIDTQVATAKAYPRDITRARNNSIALATMNEEVAQSCSYAVPRAGKPITGPSVHLARILAQQYGNIRAESRVVEITESHVVSRGMAIDLESNYAVCFEVRRSIKGKYGRFSEDMITVTGNAANAIAFRNAVLAVIPKGLVDETYKAAQQFITGDLSDETILIARRKKAVDFFLSEYSITEAEVIKLCGKETINQIRANEIALLIGFQQSLKDGDTTVNDLMKPIRSAKEDISEKKKEMKTQKVTKKKKTINLP